MIFLNATKAKILHFDAVLYDTVRGQQTMGDAQTKRRDDCPRCGGGVDALTLGVAQVWAMVWAIAAGHHGVRQSRCLNLAVEVEKKIDLIKM